MNRIKESLGIISGRKYTPDEIKKIQRKGLLKYHPDKRRNDPDEIVREDYSLFQQVCDELICSNCDDNGNKVLKQQQGTPIIIIEEYIYTFAAKMSETIHTTLRTSPIRINVNYSAFDLFREVKEFTTTIPVYIYSNHDIAQMQVPISAKPTPERLEFVFPQQGNKEPFQHRGDIIIKFVILPDGIWSFDETNKMLLAAGAKNKTAIILPCGKVHTFATNDMNNNRHYLYKQIKIIPTE